LPAAGGRSDQCQRVLTGSPATPPRRTSSPPSWSPPARLASGAAG